MENLNHGDTEAQSSTEKYFKPLSIKEIWLSKEIMSICIKIHKAIGPGLLESVYANCFYYELEKCSIPFVKEQPVSVIYDNSLVVKDGLRVDCMIDDLIVVEFKAQELFHPVWEAQLLSYLKLTGKRLGYLLNFHVPLMKNGVKRLIV